METKVCVSSKLLLWSCQSQASEKAVENIYLWKGLLLNVFVYWAVSRRVIPFKLSTFRPSFQLWTTFTSLFCFTLWSSSVNLKSPENCQSACEQFCALYYLFLFFVFLWRTSHSNSYMQLGQHPAQSSALAAETGHLALSCQVTEKFQKQTNKQKILTLQSLSSLM